jgi:hypothetical protein
MSLASSAWSCGAARVGMNERRSLGHWRVCAAGMLDWTTWRSACGARSAGRRSARCERFHRGSRAGFRRCRGRERGAWGRGGRRVNALGLGLCWDHEMKWNAWLYSLQRADGTALLPGVQYAKPPMGLKTGGSQMDPNEAMGFFPERHVLRARRLRAMGDVPSDPSDALTRCMATWVSASVAVFTQIVAIAIIFGWISLKASLEVTLCACSCVLVCGILLGALSVRRALRRANNPSS